MHGRTGSPTHRRVAGASVCAGIVLVLAVFFELTGIVELGAAVAVAVTAIGLLRATPATSIDRPLHEQ